MTDTLEVRTVTPQEAYNTLQGHNSSRLLSPEMIKVQEGRIGITCPNELVAGLMRDKYGSLKNVTVKITPKEPTTHEKRNPPEYPASRKNIPGRYNPADSTFWEKVARGEIPDSLTFGTCLVHSGNATARQVAEEIFLEYLIGGSVRETPVFIGKNGAGKTGLLSAILNEGAQKGIVPFYLCIKDLVNYYRTHEGKPPSRLTQFPKQGIIAIDSLNGLVNYGGAPREGTQNAIENLLNASTQSQRILAFTGTEEEYLELLKTLSNSALADRLAGARRVKLEFPQTKDRAKFLEEMLKAEIQKATPGSLQEVANYLHKAIPENVSIRVLQGHIYTARGLGSAPPTLESVQRACFVQRNIPGFREEPLSPAIVLSTVSALTEISIPQIRGKLRTREISRARAIAAVALTELCQMGKSEVGAHLNRDHSTISHLLKKLSSEEVKKLLEEVKEKLAP